MNWVSTWSFFLNSCPLTFNTLCNVNWRRYLLMYFSEYMYRFIVYFKKVFQKVFPLNFPLRWLHVCSMPLSMLRIYSATLATVHVWKEFLIIGFFHFISLDAKVVPFWIRFENNRCIELPVKALSALVSPYHAKCVVLFSTSACNLDIFTILWVYTFWQFWRAADSS